MSSTMNKTCDPAMSSTTQIASTTRCGPVLLAACLRAYTDVQTGSRHRAVSLKLLVMPRALTLIPCSLHDHDSGICQEGALAESQNLQAS